MACYLGDTEMTADDVVFTHALETPWDSVSGRSPLCELCRMVNNRLGALHQAAFSFQRIGAAADTSLGGVNYTGNPAWNPAGDFSTILTQCKSRVDAMLNAETMFSFGGMVNTSGYRWRYNNAATVAAALTTALTGLIFTRQEDWKAIILALRAALESLSGAEIESQPWTPQTITIRFPAGSNAWDEGVASNKVTSFGDLNPASITPAIGGTSTDWVVDTSAGANLYGDRASRTTVHDSLFTASNRDLGVAFATDGSFPAPATVEYHGTAKTFDAATPVGFIGWEHGLEVRKTFTLHCVGTGGINLTALNGKSIPWHMEAWVLSSFDPSPLPITFSASSGSVAWSGNTSGTSATKTVVADAELTLPAISGSEDARDWWNQAEIATVVIVLDEPTFYFCIDSNGVAHDD